MTRKTTDDRGPPRQSIVKLIEGMSYRHDKWSVFSDFLEMAAISISNAVDIRQRDTRESRYMEIVKRYQKGEIEQFPKMLGELVEELETGPSDVLGRVFHDLELHNKYTGQFFTPYPVCLMMAKMNVGDGLPQKAIEDKGYLSAMEPACGSGAMVIALAHALRDEKVNYQQQFHATCIDVDAKCVHMAYLQLSLLHIPAIIVHGNSLSMEEYSRWYTPAHIMGGWNGKLRRHEAAAPIAMPEPHPIEAVRPEQASYPVSQLSLF